MKIIENIKKKIDKHRQRIRKNKEQFLETYLTRYYTRLDYEKLAIPPFVKARKEVDYLKKCGLIEVLYKQVKMGFYD